MKTLITIMFLSAGMAYGQTKEHQSKKELEQTVLSQLLLIDGLEADLKEAESNDAESIDLILKLQKENDTLRSIMKDYVKQIDELNMKNVRLATELDKCKD